MTIICLQHFWEQKDKVFLCFASIERARKFSRVHVTRSQINHTECESYSQQCDEKNSLLDPPRALNGIVCDLNTILLLVALQITLSPLVVLCWACELVFCDFRFECVDDLKALHNESSHESTCSECNNDSHVIWSEKILNSVNGFNFTEISHCKYQIYEKLTSFQDLRTHIHTWAFTCVSHPFIFINYLQDMAAHLSSLVHKMKIASRLPKHDLHYALEEKGKIFIHPQSAHRNPSHYCQVKSMSAIPPSRGKIF